MTVITKGGDAIQLKGCSQDLRIAFDNRAGRHYTITGKEMFLSKDQSSLDVDGDVKLPVKFVTMLGCALSRVVVGQPKHSYAFKS